MVHCGVVWCIDLAEIFKRNDQLRGETTSGVSVDGLGQVVNLPGELAVITSGARITSLGFYRNLP